MAAASEDTDLQFVAPPLTASATTLVRTARIHPRAIDNVRYSFTRRPPRSERVVGTLLGSILPDGTGDIRNSYGVPHVESSDDGRLDVNFHRNMLHDHLSVNPEDIVVGWYSTGLGINILSSWIHASYAAEVSNPIHLTLDTSFTNREGTIRAYLASFGLLSNRQLAARFQEIPVDLSLLEPERVECEAVDYVGPQLLNWHKLERSDQRWIDKFGELLPTSLELSDPIHRLRVSFGYIFEMDDQLYAADEKPISLPECVTRNPFPYETHFLSWASLQEESVARGGILADEMGLDKIIQCICLVLLRREDDRKSDRGATGNTLVVSFSPQYWVADVARCSVPGSTKLLVYEGSDMEMSNDKIMNYDFVVTSFPTLKKDHWRLVNGVQSLLYSVNWNRIILDEAASRHIGKPCFDLKATYRWVLTSDPFKSNYEELHSMVIFLKTPPYSFYFCTDCNCKTTTEHVCSCCDLCPRCGHATSLHFQWWRKYVIKPISKYSKYSKQPEKLQIAERAVSLLRYKYLRHFLLRRRVADCF